MWSSSYIINIYTHCKIGHSNKKKKGTNKQIITGYICNMNTDVNCVPYEVKIKKIKLKKQNKKK